MADDHVVAVIGICLAIFCFLMLLLGVGAYFGGSWVFVTQGVTKYIFVVTVFSLACYTLFYLAKGRD